MWRSDNRFWSSQKFWFYCSNEILPTVLFLIFCVYFYLFCVAFDLCIVWETNQSMFLYLRLILSPLFAILLKGKYLLLLGSFTQNLYWKLGQLAPSFGSILAVRLKNLFFRNKTFLFFKIQNWNFQNLFENQFCETSQNFNSIRQLKWK